MRIFSLTVWARFCACCRALFKSRISCLYSAVGSSYCFFISAQIAASLSCWSTNCPFSDLLYLFSFVLELLLISRLPLFQHFPEPLVYAFQFTHLLPKFVICVCGKVVRCVFHAQLLFQAFYGLSTLGPNVPLPFLRIVGVPHGDGLFRTLLFEALF